MALSAISKALNAGIQRNITIAELKHEAKVADIKLELGVTAQLRTDHHGKRLTDAQINHATWFNGLNPDQQQRFITNKQYLESLLAPTASST